MIAPAPVAENIWKLTPEEMAEKGITTVAGDLGEAMEALAADEVIRAVLGEDMFAKYYTAKMAEFNEYRTSVSQWEIDRYIQM